MNSNDDLLEFRARMRALLELAWAHSPFTFEPEASHIDEHCLAFAIERRLIDILQIGSDKELQDSVAVVVSITAKGENVLAGITGTPSWRGVENPADP